MSVPSILLLFVVSHLLLLQSAGCPESFDCGAHRKIQFPYTNSTYPECGLVTVDCKESFTEVILGGKRYEVTSPLEEDSIKIKDRELEEIINSKSCDFFGYNLSITSSPSISFTISPNLTLFRCSAGIDELYWRTKGYFRGNRGCQGQTLYYKNTSVQVPTLDSYPPNCVVSYLPIVLPPGNEEDIDLFPLLTAELTIGLYVTKECHDCHSNGGLCHTKQSGKFHCINKNEGGSSRLVLILATGII